MRGWRAVGIAVLVLALGVGVRGDVPRPEREGIDRAYERPRLERYAPLLHIPAVSREPDTVIIDHFCRYRLRNGRCPKR
jgi:hypothetical protein